MNRNGQVGFSQRVRLEWLEYTAGLVMAGRPHEDILNALRAHLQDKLSVGSNPERGNRDKAISILMKIWASPPGCAVSFRDEGLAFLRRSPAREHIPVHWCMAMVAYPFWGDVAGTVGRLLRLQGLATARQVQRRIRERYGERETVARATRRVLRAFHDWGVLSEADRKGVYAAAQASKVRNRTLMAWMLEGVLRAAEGKAEDFGALTSSACLFPFDVSPVRLSDIAKRQSLEVTHFADMASVRLR